MYTTHSNKFISYAMSFFARFKVFSIVRWAIESFHLGFFFSLSFQASNVLTVNMHQTLGHFRIDSKCIVLACRSAIRSPQSAQIYATYAAWPRTDGERFLHVILQQTAKAAAPPPLHTKKNTSLYKRTN